MIAMATKAKRPKNILKNLFMREIIIKKYLKNLNKIVYKHAIYIKKLGFNQVFYGSLATSLPRVK